MTDRPDHLNLLAPIESKPKLDLLYRDVVSAVGHPLSRRPTIRRRQLASGAMRSSSAVCSSSVARRW